MCNPMSVTILTHYHLSKELKVFGDSGVTEVLKDLNHLHDRMAMNPKIQRRCHVIKRSKSYRTCCS